MAGLVAAAVVLTALLGAPYLVYGGLFLALRPSGSPAAKRAREPPVSVVLPTYDEADIVRGKLESLVAQDYPMAQVEVVVVDASEDRTPDVVREFFADREAPSLHLIEEESRRGLAPALNDAYAAASGEVLVKTDCDSRLADDAIREAVANLADPDVGAVTGRNAEVLGGSAVEAGYRGVQARIQALESHLDSTLIFHGPCSAFAAALVEPVDRDSLADDSELALRIRRSSGKRAVFDPAVRFREAAHSGFVERRTQKDRRAMGLLRLLYRQRDALGRHGLFGRVVLPFNWWFMVVSPWLLALDVAVVTGAAVSLVGAAGLSMPVALAAFAWLGQRDALGPAQPLYALLDTQVSLLRGAVSLVVGGGDGTWDVDEELRELYDG